ncbi:MAG: DEAD/DEAH box helicase, partial [Oscillospiraceae bacterium]|nr:DEAD/DEAH box helicase [Oscillospiraceae bacterium]
MTRTQQANEPGEGRAEPAPAEAAGKVRFTDLPISAEVQRAVADMGFEEATSVQSQSIPLIMDGRDVIGHSQTGTGKTAAFGIPILELLDFRQRNVIQCLILCPTRELTMQACDEMVKFAKYKKDVRVTPIYGGQSYDRQIRAINAGVQIVIGTPGRIMDLMDRGVLNFGGVRMVVLDEADEMLSMGFRDDIETILSDVPEDRQTVLFSATMSQEIMEIAKRYLVDPRLVKVVHHQLTVPSIAQYYCESPMGKKTEVLARLLDFHDPNRSLIFCNTKRMVDDLTSSLVLRGFQAECLHGDMKQQARTNVMERFKKGMVEILIATDVAARGIDVDDIDVVYNYDVPQDIEYYVHRIGRTGRAGKDG